MRPSLFSAYVLYSAEVFPLYRFVFKLLLIGHRWIIYIKLFIVLYY